MILYLLYGATMIVCLLGLYLGSLIPVKNTASRYVSWLLVILFIHISYAATFRSGIPGLIYVDTAAPFGLIYGPMLFLTFRAIENKPISRRMAWLHFIPFGIGLLFYIYFLASYSFRINNRSEYYIFLYSAMGLSWLIYPLSILIFNVSVERKQLMERRAYYYAAILVLILAVFVLTMTLNRLVERETSYSNGSGITIYFIMLLGGLLAFNYLLKSLIRANTSHIASQGSSEINGEYPVAELLSSNLFALDQQDYAEKISHYLAEKTYLDTDFHLDQMTKDLNISKQHILQFFKVTYNESFLKVINSLRIKEACTQLEQEDFDSNIEELALQCGFNSRASFYRNFNLEMGCSPIEYREKTIFK